ncbi:DNA polymerase III subunit alpha [Pokkaliibacter plantistimulans]|uniref:DNA polymerase III subunit alpha n=1 Tax=Proteobacteria bacterium 228 TaxID=2083153 RepID=A0A2S5KJ85_9PROT|nr:DNA polymerase III subunit alpha [Pokkaliibacter plantistimulans]PPC74884.1 DNA polymerase III subunit alpha [Pokkaliibacter plantistimulans]
MTTPAFVHLRVHSEFSLVDGLVRVKDLVNASRDKGMPAVALTDRSNGCAFVKFYKAAKGAGIKPICGCDIWLEAEVAGEPPARMLLLIQNKQGYANLLELISQSFQLNQQNGIAIVKREWLAEKNAGLIALSAGAYGEIGIALNAGKQADAERMLQFWLGVFADRFYLEVQRTGRKGEENCLHACVALAEKFQVPLVATNDVVFIKEDDFEAHEARVSINQSMTLADPRRPKLYSQQQYLRSADEMAELFADLPEALENSVAIARRCNIDIQLGTYFLPDYPIPEGETINSFFSRISHEGLEWRLQSLLDANDPEYAQKKQLYVERLDFELNTINQMGFPGYFLIVMDFIQWGKDNGIPVGPGRGSGAGSLVAYALKITDLDPLKYDLLFERFLNPERVSMPDFDIDFCMDNRDRVIDYVANRYGRNAVSQIITFGTMAAKAVVRDVARVQGRPFSLGDKLSKLIPFEVGMTLKKAWEQEEALRDFVNSDEEAQEIMEMAYKLEGITRNVGKHAGGVVIAPTKLSDFAPLYCEADGSGLVTQYDKGDVEEAGLVKFDFLGLRTLTIINWALETINTIHAKQGKAPLDIARIDLEDGETYKLMQRGDTTAVFQLESRGMKELIKRLLPSCFEDIIALVALFRPGPLQSGMVDDFINRKHGRAELAWPHPDYQLESLKPVLEPTYGIILYQEQVMQIPQVMAGYTLGGADLLRRAMGKKKPEEMAKQRSVFLDGCASNNISLDLAGNIFDLVEKFAGYGFNKSHSAAYALVSYQTAWLKRHYPAPFMAAVLSADMHNLDKVVILIEECRNMKLALVLPDVNASDFMFTVNDKGEVVYGLGAIKGVGEGPIEAIVEARRNGGAFTDLFDFCERVGAKKLNKRVLEALIRSGALDKLGPSRAVLWAAIGDALQAADQQARNSDSGVFDLFGDVIAANDHNTLYSSYLSLEEWPDKERLNGEKDTLGLFVTGHPIDAYEHELKGMVKVRLADLKPSRESQLLAGLVVGVRTMKSKKGETLAFVTLDDRTGRVEVSVFGELYHQHREVLGKDAVILIEGDVSQDDFSGGLRVRAKRLLSIEEARARHAKHLELKLSCEGLQAREIQAIQAMLAPYRDQEGNQIRIHYKQQEAEAFVVCGESWRVKVADELLLSLTSQLGKQSVKLVYR